jgi:hypothetical protein
MLDFESYDHLWPQFPSIDAKEGTLLPRGLTTMLENIDLIVHLSRRDRKAKPGGETREEPDLALSLLL